MKLVEEHTAYLELQLPSASADLKLSELFTLIHEAKAEGVIEEFSVSQVLDRTYLGSLLRY